jgi:hypothetical protein
VRGRSAEHVAQQRMEVNAALPWRGLIPVEYIRRLHHQLYCVWPQRLQTTQFKEGGIPLTICRLYGDVVDQAAHATCELAASSLERANDVRQLKRSLVSSTAKGARFSVVSIEVVMSVSRLDCAVERVESKRNI